jgi:hypothetical protein
MIEDLDVQELADQFHGWLSEITTALEVPDTLRARAAAALLYGALAHFNSICFLTAHADSHPSAFALLRVQWQALLNGLWMHFCCPKSDVKKYANGRRQFPHFDDLVRGIEGAIGTPAGGGPLSQEHAMIKQSMHNFTHMGSLQIASINAGGVIGTAYPQSQIDGLLITVVRIMLYTVAGVSVVSERPGLQEEARGRYTEFHDELTRRLSSGQRQAQRTEAPR